MNSAQKLDETLRLHNFSLEVILFEVQQHELVVSKLSAIEKERKIHKEKGIKIKYAKGSKFGSRFSNGGQRKLDL